MNSLDLEFGLGEADRVQEIQVRCLGLPDRFIAHGPREALLHDVGLDAEGIATEVRLMLGDAVSATVEFA